MGKNGKEAYAEMGFICANGTILYVNTNMSYQERYEIRATYWASFDTHTRKDSEKRFDNEVPQMRATEVAEKRRKFKKKERSGAGIR